MKQSLKRKEYKYCYVKFALNKMNFGGGKYLYYCGDLDVQSGYVVDVPTSSCKSNMALVTQVCTKQGAVLSVGRSPVLTVNKIVCKSKREFCDLPLKFMKSYISLKIVKRWKIEKYDFGICFKEPSFLGSIFYDFNDGYLEYSIGNIMTGNYFQDDIITSAENFGLKILYLQTILTHLHKGTISLDQFNSLLEMV